jgi:hypothetical protein
MSNQSTTAAPVVTSIVPASLLTIPAYLVEKTDPETGEMIHVPKYKYIIGAPKQYRFNGQNGQFNINGEQILLDTKGKAIDSFSFQPIAWRIFEENLFARGRKETWAELFFVDAKDCVSSIMVNNTTLEELRKLAENLFYDDITLADIVLTIKPEKAENEREGQKRSWYIGRFSYQLADPAKVKEFKEYARDYPIYRRDTLTTTAVYLAKSDTYYIPLEEPHEAAIVLPETIPQAA